MPTRRRRQVLSELARLTRFFSVLIVDWLRLQPPGAARPLYVYCVTEMPRRK